MKCELYNENFQNYKSYNIPKAQLIIADIPYNIGKNFYGSNPSWYVGGNRENGESKLAGKAAFNTDFSFNITEFFHFVSRMLKPDPKKKTEGNEPPCILVFCSYEQQFEALDALADKIVYTGPIDAYFDYKLGTLEYRSVRFENELLDKPSFQGNAAVNYTDRETPWTRIIEHKWFEFGKDENGNDLPKTIISREYSSEWKPGDEPYYPVNDAKNGALYAEYKKLADAESKVIFGGRLGEYKYYDMDQVIAAVLDRCESELH